MLEEMGFKVKIETTEQGHKISLWREGCRNPIHYWHPDEVQVTVMAGSQDLDITVNSNHALGMMVRHLFLIRLGYYHNEIAFSDDKDDGVDRFQTNLLYQLNFA